MNFQREADPLPLGWLHDGEAALLTELAAGRIVLELGAWKGRSTTALAQSAFLVVSVDWHRGDWATQGVHPNTDTLPNYLRNVRELENVVPIIGRFEVVLPLLRPGSFGVAFVDGAHDAASVRHDFEWARRLVHSGGLIACHDWECAPQECTDTLRELAGEPERVVDYTAVFRV